MHDPKDYTASVLAEGIWLYRLLTDPERRSDDFLSNSARGDERLWPKNGEDYLSWLGISCFERDSQAEALGRSVNERWVRQGKGKRWSHYARFYVDGHRGHVCAREGPVEGHFAVWGEPSALDFSRDEPIPITDPEG